MKKKYLVWGAIATIGAILIYTWKKNQDKEDKKNEESNDVNNGTPKSESASQQNTSNTGGNTGGSTSVAPTQAQIDLAVAYRKWANSTDALKKKWGKTSTYDLDETSTTPYNTFFTKSYDGGGKAEYEAYLKSQSSAGKAETQKTANKKQMDNLAFAWGGHPAVTKSTDARGRVMKFRFLPTWKSDGDYYWYLYFIETASGKTAPTYYITDGFNKEFQTGYWTFNGSVYSFNAVTGKNKGTKISSIADLKQAVNKLGGQYVYNNIEWQNG
jgi:hypothetical protein